MKNNNINKKLSDNCADGADEILLSSNAIAQVVKSKEQKATENALITFGEALERTKFGCFNIFVIVITGMILANVLLETSTLGFVMPIAQCDLNLTNQDKGALMAIGFIGIILSSHLWGFLADTKGRRTVIRPTLLVTFITSVLSSFSYNFWTMLVLRFCNGFLVSGGSATIYAYLGEMHTDKSRSRAMMGAAFIFAVGAMLCPILAFLIINQDWVLPITWLGIIYKPWRLFLVVAGSPGFLCGLSLFILPESPKYLLAMGRVEECKKVLQKIYKWNGGKGTLLLPDILPDEDTATVLPTAAAVPEVASKSNFFVVFMRTMWRQTVPLFNKKYLRTTLISCTIQFWLYVATNGMYMWFPHIINSMAAFIREHPGEAKQMCHIVYDKEEALYQTDGSMTCVTKLEQQTFIYSFTMEVSYATSFAILGLIINHLGKKPIICVTIIIFTACGLAAVLISNPAIAAYLYVLYFLVGVAINVMSAVIVELYPTQMRAMAICISLMFGRLGSVVGAYVVGLLLSSYCEITFYAAAAFLLTSAFLALFLPKIHSEDVMHQSKTPNANSAEA